MNYRLRLTSFIWVLVMTGALLAANSALAATIWFTNDDADGQWGNPLNWKIELGGGAHTTGLPDATLPTYITSSDHQHGGGTLSPGTATLDMGTIAETATFYVGGWDTTLNAEHGDPRDHIGTLNIISGQITPSATAGSPPCHYMRLGHRGARGTINQSGGTMFSCTYLSIGFQSADGTGIWNLSGGVIDAYGLDIGAMGLGIVDVSGGQIQPQTTAPTVGRTNVGRGYFTSLDRYEPGVGLLNQTGGDIDQVALRIAEGVGSAGIYTLRDGGDVSVTTVVHLGFGGSGSWSQLGGTADVGAITLGRFAGASGTFTMSAGSFTQSDPAQAFINGNGAGDGGRGSVVIIGSDPLIDVERYVQNGVSRYTVMLDELAPHVSSMTVDQSATFSAGAVLDVDIMPSAAPFSADLFEPTPLQTFELMTVTNGSIIDNGLALADEDVADWQIEIATDSLSVRYCSGYAGQPSCGPDGDLDGFADAVDNCPLLFNYLQLDSDGDGIGDGCDLACDDGADNDLDGLIDFPNDPGCGSPLWAIENPSCDDKNDNDNDGLIDFPADPSCPNASSSNELTLGCGLGFELAILLPPLMWIQRRRRNRSSEG